MYTRKQALEDGVLIDVTEMAKEAGFRWPVAVTLAAWCQVITPHQEAVLKAGQSVEGRLWDMLTMLGNQLPRGGQEHTLLFQFLAIIPNKKGKVEIFNPSSPGPKSCLRAR